MDKSKKILLIGGGKMGGALLGGWLQTGLLPDQFLVQEPHPSDALMALGVRVVAGLEQADNFAPDIVIIAIKPQNAASVLPPLSAALPTGCLVLSLLAGTPIVRLKVLMTGDFHFVRTMPNTPAAIGLGISALIGDADVPAELRMQAEWLMQAVGETIWLDHEDQINAVTAISGSGPAYVFYLAEVLAGSGEALGLDPSTAIRLAYQTIAGAGAMLDLADANAGDLRRNVTSPGGTTEAALEVLMAETGLGDLMRRATSAAVQRARALAIPDKTEN